MTPASLTATVKRSAQRRNGRLTPEESAEYERRYRAQGWGQNQTARKIGKDGGLFSRWLHGHLASSVIRKRLDRVLERAEAKQDRRSGNGAPQVGRDSGQETVATAV
jgi:hypothetical protein